MAKHDKKKKSLSHKPTLNKKLLQYSLAAGATLTLAIPMNARAEIMYSGPLNIPVDNETRTIDMETFSDQEPATGEDFRFENSGSTYTYIAPGTGTATSSLAYHENIISAASDAGALMEQSTGNKYFPVSLAASNWVSSQTETENLEFRGDGYINFHVNHHSAGTSSDSYPYGNFLGKSGYIGVRFEINQKTHYGWIQFESTPNGSAGTIIDWAYESEPDTKIHVGERPEPAAIPTLNEWGLIFLAALILAEGGRRIRKKEGVA